MERTNDWIAVQINRPDLDLPDLKAMGITPDNTGMREREYYETIPKVQEAFKDKSGNFDHEKFNAFYDSALAMYNSYSSGEYVERLLNSIAVSPYSFSTLTNPNKKVQDTRAVVGDMHPHDPNRRSYGTGNLWEVGAPSFSIREISEANFVRDEDGNKLDWTPNDKGGLWKGLWRPTLVVATYDEDGFHMEDGVQVPHLKGQLKLDENGDPYTEILGNREMYGKEVIHYSDTLTREGTFLNKMDFFDSDGLDKSIGGTIAKTAAKLAPWLLPGGWGAALGNVAAIWSMAEVLPVIAKSINGIMTNDNTNGFGLAMTRWENFMGRYGSSQSDYGRSHFFSAENIGTIVADSASQLFSQKQVAKNAKSLAKLLGAKEFASSDIGRQLSLGYMAITSSQQYYGEFKQAGASDAVAGWGSLLTMSLMYGLMNQGYFKDKLFEGTALDEERLLNKTVADVIKGKDAARFGRIIEEANIAAKSADKKVVEKGAKKFFFKAGNLIKSAWRKLPKGKVASSGGDITNRAINEAIEETMEEATSDFVKGIIQGLQVLGVNVTDSDYEELEFDWDPKMMLQRYGAAFIGGAIGGATFEGLQKWGNLWSKEILNLNKMTSDDRFMWFLANGYGDKMKNIVDKRGKLHLNGNHNLSASLNIDENGAIVAKAPFAAAKAGEVDQNTAITNEVKELINAAEGLLSLDGIITDRDLLYAKALQRSSVYKAAEEKFKEDAEKAGLSADEYRLSAKQDPLIATFKALGLFDAISDDANYWMVQILRDETEIYKVKKAIAEQYKGDQESDRTAFDTAIKKSGKLKMLEERKKIHMERYQDIISGKHADEYISLARFAADDTLKSLIITDKGRPGNLHNKNVSSNEQGVANYALAMYGIKWSDLSDDEKSVIDEEYKSYLAVQSTATSTNIDTPKSVEERLVFQREGNSSNKVIRRAHDIYYGLNEYFADTITKSNSDLKNAVTNSALYRVFTPDEIKENPMLGLAKEFFGSHGQMEAISNLEMAQRLSEIIQRGKTEMGIIEKENPDKSQDELDADETYATIKANTEHAQSVFERINSGNILRYTLALDESSKLNFIYDDGTIIQTGEDVVNLLSAVKDYYADKVKTGGVASMVELDPLKDALEKLVGDDFNESVSDILLKIIMEGTYGVEEEALQAPSNNLYADFAALRREIVRRPMTAKAFYENLKKTEVYREVPEQLMDDLFGMYFKVSPEVLFGTLDSIKDSYSKMKKTPILSILSQFGVLLDSKAADIFDILNSEEETMSAGKLEDYVLNNPGVIDSLNEALYMIEVIRNVLGDAQNGANEYLNKYREGIGKNPLGIIDENVAYIYDQELSILRDKIDNLLSIAKVGSEKLSKEQISVGLNMETLEMKKLTHFSLPDQEKPDTLYSSIIKKITSDSSAENEDVDEFVVDTNKIWEEIGGDIDLDDVTEENSVAFYVARRAFRKSVREKCQRVIKHIGEDNFIKLLVENMPNDVIKCNAGKWTDDKKEVISPYAMLGTIFDIVFEDPNLDSLYKKVAFDNDQYMPFPAQENVVKHAYTVITHIKQANTLLNALKDKAKKLGLLEEGRAYLDNKPTLYNFMMVDGYPGVGKSTAVGHTLQRMLELTGWDTAAGAWSETRAKRVYSSIGVGTDLSKALIISDPFFEKLGVKSSDFYYESEEELKKEGKKSREHNVYLKDDVKLSTDPSLVWGKETKKGVLFIDEVTFYNEAQLQALSEYVNGLDGEFIIIGLGDLRQQSATFMNDSGLADTNIKDCLYLTSPTLTVTMRAHNEGSRYNHTLLTRMVTEAFDKVKSEYVPDPVEVNRFIKDNLLKRNDQKYIIDAKFSTGKLTFYEDESSTLYGIKKSTRESTKYQIEKWLKSGVKPSDILIITDNNEYDNLVTLNSSEGSIRVFSGKDAQGEEALYTIVDVEAGTEDSEYYSDLGKLYTFATRSEQGTIFVENGKDLLKRFNLECESNIKAALKVFDPKSNAQKKLNEKYIKWRKSCFEGVPDWKTPSTTSEEEPGPKRVISGEQGGTSPQGDSLFEKETDDFVEKAEEVKDEWDNIETRDINEHTISKYDKERYVARKELIESGKQFYDSDTFDAAIDLMMPSISGYNSEQDAESILQGMYDSGDLFITPDNIVGDTWVKKYDNYKKFIKQLANIFAFSKINSKGFFDESRIKKYVGYALEELCGRQSATFVDQFVDKDAVFLSEKWGTEKEISLRGDSHTGCMLSLLFTMDDKVHKIPLLFITNSNQVNDKEFVKIPDLKIHTQKITTSEGEREIPLGIIKIDSKKKNDTGKVVSTAFANIAHPYDYADGSKPIVLSPSNLEKFGDSDAVTFANRNSGKTEIFFTKALPEQAKSDLINNFLTPIISGGVLVSCNQAHTDSNDPQTRELFWKHIIRPVGVQKRFGFKDLFNVVRAKRAVESSTATPGDKALLKDFFGFEYVPYESETSDSTKEADGYLKHSRQFNVLQGISRKLILPALVRYFDQKKIDDQLRADILNNIAIAFINTASEVEDEAKFVPTINIHFTVNKGTYSEEELSVYLTGAGNNGTLKWKVSVGKLNSGSISTIEIDSSNLDFHTLSSELVQKVLESEIGLSISERSGYSSLSEEEKEKFIENGLEDGTISYDLGWNVRELKNTSGGDIVSVDRYDIRTMKIETLFSRIFGWNSDRDGSVKEIALTDEILSDIDDFLKKDARFPYNIYAGINVGEGRNAYISIENEPDVVLYGRPNVESDKLTTDIVDVIGPVYDVTLKSVQVEDLDPTLRSISGETNNGDGIVNRDRAYVSDGNVYSFNPVITVNSNWIREYISDDSHFDSLHISEYNAQTNTITTNDGETIKLNKQLEFDVMFPNFKHLNNRNNITLTNTGTMKLTFDKERRVFEINGRKATFKYKELNYSEGRFGVEDIWVFDIDGESRRIMIPSREVSSDLFSEYRKIVKIGETNLNVGGNVIGDSLINALSFTEDGEVDLSSIESSYIIELFNRGEGGININALNAILPTRIQGMGRFDGVIFKFNEAAGEVTTNINGTMVTFQGQGWVTFLSKTRDQFTIIDSKETKTKLRDDILNKIREISGNVPASIRNNMPKPDGFKTALDYFDAIKEFLLSDNIQTNFLRTKGKAFNLNLIDNGDGTYDVNIILTVDSEQSILEEVKKQLPVTNEILEINSKNRTFSVSLQNGDVVNGTYKIENGEFKVSLKQESQNIVLDSLISILRYLNTESFKSLLREQLSISMDGWDAKRVLEALSYGSSTNKDMLDPSAGFDYILLIDEIDNWKKLETTTELQKVITKIIDRQTELTKHEEDACTF